MSKPVLDLQQLDTTNALPPAAASWLSVHDCHDASLISWSHCG